VLNRDIHPRKLFVILYPFVMDKKVAEVIWKALEDSDPGSGEGYKMPGPSHEGFLFDGTPTTLVSGGERGAKSHTGAMKCMLITLDFIARHPLQASKGVSWLVGDSYELTRSEFDNLSEWFQTIVPGTKVSTRVDPGQIEVPVRHDDHPGLRGVFTIKTKSAADPMSLRAEAPIWIYGCEAALLTQDVYFRLLGRAGQSRSMYKDFGQFILTGTFENSLGWYPTLWTKWQSGAAQVVDRARSFSFPSHENRFAWPGGEKNETLMHLKNMLPEDVYKERHLAIPAPPSGRVFGNFDSTVHVQKCSYDPDLPVYLGIDPGYSGRSSTYAVEAMQKVADQWVVFDEIAINKISDPGFTVKDICYLAQQRYWWKNADKVGVIDIAGAAHAGAQESNEEVWLRETGLVLRHQRVNLLPGLDRMKTSLQVNPIHKEPGIIFDPSCKLVISELGGAVNPFDNQVHVYSYKTDRQGNVTDSRPRDDYCDGIKAIIYLLVDQMGYATGRGLRKRIRVKRRSIRHETVIV